jgi:penicillin-binding protein 1A
MVKKTSKSKKTTRKSKKKARKSSRKTQQRGWFATLFAFCMKWGLVIGLWMAIFLSALLFWYASELPNITKSMVFERRPTVIIKASDGEIVDRYGDIKGNIVRAEELPDYVTHAILATEDRRFYDHFGMDLKGIGRAFVVNIMKGGFVQGGSTLTQQLAKNLFLTRERTIKRKVQELMLAFQLERELTKDEILSAYMNRVYLGSGAYGIDAAAKVYFNKSAKELNLKEAATIAGLLKAPSRYSPNANPEKSAARTKVVLKGMVDAGYVTEEEIARYKNAPPAPRRKPSSGDSVRYYSDYIVAQLDDLIGQIDQDVVVETTMDQAIQSELEESITKAVLRYGPDKEVEQAAGAVMRHDGAVVALMGGRDYGMSEFNRVTDALRPPGSSFKPIVYLTALEKGWNLNNIIVDEPRRYYGGYRPRNYGNEYYGEVTLFEALTLSLNTVAVELTKQVGPDAVVDTARRLGITADLESSLSTALGSNGVPMLQMVTAYSILGRGGQSVEPYSIKKISDTDGNILYERPPAPKSEQVVDQNAVRQLTAMMQSVIASGTGRGASIPYPAAGKTGTSQDFRDAWFVGFSTKYAAAIWFGNDDNSPTKRLTGGSAPAQVWREVMTTAQTRGGKSYGLFSNISYDKEDEFAFHEMLARIAGENRFDPFNQGWFSNLFGDGSGRTELDQRMQQQRQDMHGRPPPRNLRGQELYEYNVNE